MTASDLIDSVWNRYYVYDWYSTVRNKKCISRSKWSSWINDWRRFKY